MIHSSQLTIADGLITTRARGRGQYNLHSTICIVVYLYTIGRKYRYGITNLTGGSQKRSPYRHQITGNDDAYMCNDSDNIVRIWR